LNAEANLNVLDRDFALEEHRAFDLDRISSHRVTPGEWNDRPRLNRIGDWFAGLLGSQL
jgi:cardiolipin synthase